MACDPRFMRDWKDPADEDEGEPLPGRVTRRWGSWAFGLIMLTVGVVATSHRWWTIPAALAIGVIIFGVHYVWWPEIPASRSRPATPLPRSEASDPETDGDDVVIVRRRIE